MKKSGIVITPIDSYTPEVSASDESFRNGTYYPKNVMKKKKNPQYTTHMTRYAHR